MPLAERRTVTPGGGLLATDSKGSVIHVQGEGGARESHAYSAYGHNPALPSPHTVLGFNAECMHLPLPSYLLGAGLRAFSPSLLRFSSPDSWSPFGTGGLNAYAYCLSDPINRIDPSGHSSALLSLFKGIANRLHLRTPRPATPVLIEATKRKVSAVVAEAENPYSSVGSSRRDSSISSDYASLESYTSVSDHPPSLPSRSPPHSAAGGSRFTTGNSNREPSGQAHGEIQKWVDRSSTAADRQLIDYSQFPHVGVGSNKRHLSVINAGVRRSEEFQIATQVPRPLTVHRDGKVFLWRDRKWRDRKY
nr:RHS repeat-associated core domain-containing protein [Pseudomonas fakonensis]